MIKETYFADKSSVCGVCNTCHKHINAMHICADGVEITAQSNVLMSTICRYNSLQRCPCEYAELVEQSSVWDIREARLLSVEKMHT